MKIDTLLNGKMRWIDFSYPIPETVAVDGDSYYVKSGGYYTIKLTKKNPNLSQRERDWMFYKAMNDPKIHGAFKTLRAYILPFSSDVPYAEKPELCSVVIDMSHPELFPITNAFLRVGGSDDGKMVIDDNRYIIGDNAVSGVYALEDEYIFVFKGKAILDTYSYDSAGTGGEGILDGFDTGVSRGATNYTRVSGYEKQPFVTRINPSQKLREKLDSKHFRVFCDKNKIAPHDAAYLIAQHSR